MRVWKRLTAVGCAAMVLFSANGIGQQPLFEFPAMITASAATTYDISTGDITITDSGEYIITGSTTEYKIIIQGGNPKITVQDVNIDLSSADGCPLDIQSGSCTLILDGTSILMADYQQPAIKVETGKALIINGTGTLNATGGSYGAGIGGGSRGSGGNITIEGGTVTATSRYYAAGIGGGYLGSGGNITIEDGTVTASGGQYGAGIGGGWYGNGGNITIEGGTVTATGGMYSAGIGGGNYGSGGNITFTGGVTTATKGSGNGNQENIGHGKDGENSGDITYKGGTVNGTVYQPEPSYTVTIPASIKLGETATISATDVENIPNGENLNVKLSAANGNDSGDLTLKDTNNDDNEMTYTISGDNTRYNVGDTVLSTNIDKEVTLKFEPEIVLYAGHYTGSVTFTVSVE